MLEKGESSDSPFYIDLKRVMIRKIHLYLKNILSC